MPHTFIRCPLLKGKKEEMNEGLIISILDTYSKNFESLQSYTQKSIKNRLIRNKKVKYFISIENSKVRALIGLKELSKDYIYCAIHINSYAFDQLLDGTSFLINSTLKYKKKIIFQSWIHHENRNEIRNAIKSGFRESLPIFNRGYYIVSNEDIKDIPIISCLSKASMLDHDAF